MATVFLAASATTAFGRICVDRPVSGSAPLNLFDVACGSWARNCDQLPWILAMTDEPDAQMAVIGPISRSALIRLQERGIELRNMASGIEGKQPYCPRPDADPYFALGAN
jgi:hypothetical protein